MVNSTYFINYAISLNKFLNCRLSPILVFDYCTLILGAIFSKSVGITLSLGISVICKSFSDAHDDDVR